MDGAIGLDPCFEGEAFGMGKGETERAGVVSGKPAFEWLDDARREMERELTVHVVTIVCMRKVAERVLSVFGDWVVDPEVQPFGVGWRMVCRFPAGGVEVAVDRGLTVELVGDVVIVLVPDDALCGGATITSRWTRPEV